MTTLLAEPSRVPAAAVVARSPTGPRGQGLRWFLLFALCVFSALLGRLCYLARPFDSDGSMFIYMGRLVADGGRWGHDLVDNKFPSVGLIMSAPWRLFGANWSAYVLLGAGLSLLGCAMLARIAARHIGRHAVVPALLFALVYLNFNFAVFGGFQLETVQAFFAILAAGAGMEYLRDNDCRDAFTCGLCAGVAAMLKPTGLAVFGAVLFAAAASRRSEWRWRGWPGVIAQIVSVLAGLAVPAVAVLVYLVATETLGDMPALWRQIARYAASSAWEASDWTKPLTVLVIGGFPMLVRAWIFRHAGDRFHAQVNRTMLLFVLAWLALETAGVAMQRRMYAYHFLVLAPPATLLFALLPRRQRIAALAASLVPTALFSIYGGSLVLAICYTGQSRSPLGDYVAQHTMAGDAVWKDDAARLWLETGCRAGSRFPMTFLFANYDEAPIEYVTRMIDDFERTRPKYIVLPAQRDRVVEHQSTHIVELARFPRRRDNFRIAWQRIGEYVDRHYTLEVRIGNDAVYRRR